MAETRGVWSNYMIMSRKGGIFQGLRFEESFAKNNLLEVHCTCREGDEVRPYRNTTDSLGTILFKAETVEEMTRITADMDAVYQAEVREREERDEEGNLGPEGKP